MKRVKFYISALLVCIASAVLSACSGIDLPENHIPSDGKVTVMLGQPIKVVSRTAVASDGYTSTWAEGDAISLWATAADGAAALAGETFTMWRFDKELNTAVFTADITPMTGTTYTYNALYPAPSRVEGTKAVYSFGTEQTNDGFAGNYDVMVAEPVSGAALTDGEVNNIDLRFKHKMHALKIVIPKGGNLLGGPITRIEFEFASPVTGDITVDYSDPDAPATLSNGSRFLAVNFPNGIDEGDTAWAMIFPTDISGDMSYTAYSGGYKSWEHTVRISKVAAESHLTPMSMSIPELERITTVSLSIGANYLGEDVRKLSIVNEGGSVLKSFTANSSNVYDIVYNGEFDGSQLSGKTFTARFESDNAIVERNFTMPTIESYVTTKVAPVDVPYLLFEDFSGMTGNISSNDGGSSLSDTGTSGILLSSYSLPGWNGARIGGQAGTCVRINARFEGAWVATSRYCGRLDTPAIKGIKSGSSVKLKVEFDAGYYHKSGINIDDSADESMDALLVGKHTSSESSAINGANYSSIGSVSYTFDTFQSKYDADSYGKTFPTYSCTIDGCGSTSRIVWWATTKRSSGIGNANYYYYIDNIKISIAK